MYCCHFYFSLFLMQLWKTAQTYFLGVDRGGGEGIVEWGRRYFLGSMSLV